MGGGSRCAEMGRVGRGRPRVTSAASVRLLSLFADRLLCHHEPQASLLRVMWGIYGGFDHNNKMCYESGGGDRRRRQHACFVSFLTPAGRLTCS